MDVMDEEILEFWKILNKNHVAYIMVGGFAVNMHGYARTTKDSDLWLKDELINRQHLRQAFKDLGYGDHPSLETIDFIPGWTEFNIGGGIVLDIMTSMKGLEDQSFDICYKRAVRADLNGIIVPFLHINDLITNKKAVSRPTDQIDVQELEKIQKLQQEQLQKKE
ncbi:MAG: DUF6036 family nucleotidyltransferase [Chitinophagaceae bacterium]